jgi:hypothetical protein
MVDGKYEDLSAEFVDRLKDWIDRGGRLVATQRSARWVVEQEIVKADYETFDEPETSRWVRFEERDGEKQSSEIAGAIFDVQLDSSHPITFGLEQRIASFKTNRDVLKPSTDAGATVGVYTKEPILSGYVPRDRTTAFEGKAMALSLERGDGRVILMEDSPTFRGFWYGTQRLILNAVLLAEAY